MSSQSLSFPYIYISIFVQTVYYTSVSDCYRCYERDSGRLCREIEYAKPAFHLSWLFINPIFGGVISDIFIAYVCVFPHFIGIIFPYLCNHSLVSYHSGFNWGIYIDPQ
jgi:hypothetical protein